MNLGGGENVLQGVLSKTTFGGLKNRGWSGRCLVLLREMTESRQKGGGKTYRRCGVQKRFWGGVFRRIYGMFSTPPEFSTPLGRSLTKAESVGVGACSHLPINSARQKLSRDNFCCSVRHHFDRAKVPPYNGSDPMSPWRSQSPFASRPSKTSKNTGTQGVCARYDLSGPVRDTPPYRAIPF